MFLGQLAKQHDRADANTVRSLPDNIPNRKERKTYLHFHFHTFTEDLTMGTAVLSFLLYSSRLFHSKAAARQRSTTVLVRENKTSSSNQRIDLSICIYISTEHSLNECLFLMHLDEEKIPGKATTAAKAINN